MPCCVIAVSQQALVVNMENFINTQCRRLALLALTFTAVNVSAQVTNPNDTISGEHELEEVAINATNGTRLKVRIENTDLIGEQQLVRAACCNLGESFTTNPSVDVSYSDAATGAKQIKLLGLSGTYVQMLTENMPNLRGASLPYSLGYVPGPWMQSIQVSKGASSVKNGYESTTGQINIEYRKPQGIDGLRGNVYLDNELKQEVNLDGSIHINDKLSTSLLLHFENRQTDHDGNHDGFMDMPKVRQFNGMHRWAYVAPHWISQLSFRALRDERISGQSPKHVTGTSLYETSVKTNRYEFQWKNGFPINSDHNTSLALMMNGSYHDASNKFGHVDYDVTQKNGYAQLMFETDFTESHNLSVGASINHDYYKEWYDTGMEAFPAPSAWLTTDRETTTGLYLQYTYKLGDKLTVMPGIRWDYSDRYGSFYTPRLHIKFAPNDVFTIRGSVGKGYRTPHALAENVTLLASGRTIYIDDNLKQEEAWNYGVSTSLNIPIGEKTLELNAEYYYTDFRNQMVLNFNGYHGAHTLSFENLDGKSYSHTVQVDATYPFFEGFTATAAFRLNDVKCTYRVADPATGMTVNELRTKPLTSRYKGLLTLSYTTPMELWRFDVTGQLNGDGYLYPTYKSAVEDKYPSYFQLQAQITREFLHFDIYLGGENLTNYKISDPIISAHDPWSHQFDATQVWGPITGAMAYIGIRLKFEQ